MNSPEPSAALCGVLPGSDPAVQQAAGAHLRAGGLLGLPTETVYGLAADASNDAAVAAIFATKARPVGHPLIVHVAASALGQDAASAPPAAVAHFAASVPGFALALMHAFWPGPLTLILPRRAGVATAAAGGQNSIGLRCPAHPVAQGVLAACAAAGIHGLAAPSANRFGRISPTTAQHVADEFDGAVPVLDGGPCAVGIESSIIDCTRGVPVLLRPGQITRAQIERVCQMLVQHPGAAGLGGAGAAPRASGTLPAHYAPRARLRLMDAKMLQTALDVLGAEAAHIAIWSRTVLKLRSQKLLFRRMPADAQAAAQQLFAVLRGFDAAGVELIWVETPPPEAPWEAVYDRLTRAAAAA